VLGTLVRGGFDGIVAEVLLELDAAEGAAAQLGSAGATDFIRRRRESVARIRESFFRTLLENL
jgi:uncharacterized protein (UPF0303 family)